MSTLNIKKIKEILEANGTDYSDCMEKSDFIQRLNEVRARAAKRPEAGGSDQPPPRRRTAAEGSTGRSSNGTASSGVQVDPSSSTEEIIQCSQQTKDYYAILGVPRDAGIEEIKKAYKKLALKLHPDKCKLPGAEDAFKKLANAFHCLSDPDKRSRYDRTGEEDGPGGHGGFGGGADADDIFKAFFGGGGMPAGAQFHFAGGGNIFEELFRQQHHQQQRRRGRRVDDDEVHERQERRQGGGLELGPWIGILPFILPLIINIIQYLRSPLMLLLPLAVLVPARFRSTVFMGIMLFYLFGGIF